MGIYWYAVADISVRLRRAKSVKKEVVPNDR